MAGKASLDHALTMFRYYADDAIKARGAPKSAAELEAVQANVLEQLEIGKAQRAYLSNLVSAYVMEKTGAAIPGVLSFKLLSNGRGGRLTWDILLNARADVLRNLSKAWDAEIEIKQHEEMAEGKDHNEWNSWTTPNPFSAADGRAYSARRAKEEAQAYKGTPFVEDLHPIESLSARLSVAKMVDAAKEFPFMSGRPAFVSALALQGLNRGIIMERERLSVEEPRRGIAPSGVSLLPFGKEIDAILELVDQRFDLGPRLFKEPKSNSRSVFERAIVEARERLSHEPPIKGRGAKKAFEKRLLIASLLVMGEWLGRSIVQVTLDPPKRADEVLERVFEGARS